MYFHIFPQLAILSSMLEDYKLKTELLQNYKHERKMLENGSHDGCIIQFIHP